MKLKSKKLNSRGSILIEAMIAISVVSIGLLGVTNLLSYSIRTNARVESQLVATYLAAEGIEVTKNIIDKNYSDIGEAKAQGRAYDSWNSDIRNGSFEMEYDSVSLGASIGDGRFSERNLFFNPEQGLYYYGVSGDGGLMTGFKRTVMIEEVVDVDCDETRVDALRVVSRVEWQANDGSPEEVSLEDHFFDWRDESETDATRKYVPCES